MKNRTHITFFLCAGILLFFSCSQETVVSEIESDIITNIIWTRSGERIATPDSLMTMRITVDIDNRTNIKEFPYSSSTARIGPYPMGTKINIMWEALNTKDVVVFSGVITDLFLNETKVNVTIALEEVRHKVSFIDSINDSIVILFSSHGGSLLEPIAPEREAHHFSGWYCDDDFAANWNFETDRITQDTVLYAKWIPLYRVAYEGNENTKGTPPAEELYREDEEIKLPNEGTLFCTGHDFSGWNSLPDGTGQSYPVDTVIVIAEEMVFYAHWERIKYNVNFESSGGSSIDDKNVAYGNAVEEPPDPTRGNDIFSGWYSDELLTISWNFETDRITQDTVLYAKWIPLYRVEYNGNGNTAGTPHPYRYYEEGEEIEIPDEGTLINAGYFLSSWNSEPNGSGQSYSVDTMIVITENLVLYAQWEPELVIADNQIGVHSGYNYHFWKDLATTGRMVLKRGGAFSCEWAGDNIKFSKGLQFDDGRSHSEIGNISIDYDVDFNAENNSISMLLIYGWTTNPLTEFHIVESWEGWRPPGSTPIGEISVDGAIYDIYRIERLNQPSIIGNADYQQYWSVRREKNTSGTTSISVHFETWESMNMPLGEMYDISLMIEGYSTTTSSTADVRINKIITD